jgi:hypothetical protein
MDPRCISIDIETYGKLSTLPDQTVFTPRRSLYIDGVHPKDIVQSIALTLPTKDPRSRGSDPWSAIMLASLKPGQTMVFDARSKRDIHWLTKWLDHADTLFGMNIAFDILYLRAFSPFLHRALSGRHLLIDLSVINYLQCEVRPERSLKTLGPVLGTHIYKESDLRRFTSWSQLPSYNGADTHNTLTAIAALSRRIDPSTPKLSPFCLDFYSESLWSFISMSENGVPISKSQAESLLTTLTKTMTDSETEAAALGLTLSGHGSQKSKDEFLTKALMEVEGSKPDLDYNMLTLTEKTRKISFSDANRSYIKSFIPPTSQTHRLFELIDAHQHAQKLIGSYLYPLLRHKRALKNGNVNRSSLLVPQPGVSHPCPLPPPPSTPSSPSPSQPTSTPTPSAEDPSSTSNTTSSRKPRRSKSKKADTTQPINSEPSPTTCETSPTTSTTSPKNSEQTNDCPF